MARNPNKNVLFSDQSGQEGLENKIDQGWGVGLKTVLSLDAQLRGKFKS